MLIFLCFVCIFSLERLYETSFENNLVDKHTVLDGVVEFKSKFRHHEIKRSEVRINVHSGFGKGRLSLCFTGIGECADVEVMNDANGQVTADITYIVLALTDSQAGGEYKTIGDADFSLSTDDDSLSVDVTDIWFMVDDKDTNDLYDHYGSVLEFTIRLLEKDMEYLDEDPVREEYVPANVTFDGYTYDLTGVRYKGAASSLVQCCTPGPRLNEDECRKLSMKIDTYEFRRDKDENGEYIYPKSEQKRKIYRQKKINLLGMESRSKDKVLHPTIPMRSYYDQMVEFIGGEFARMIGVYMASSRYATITTQVVKPDGSVDEQYRGLFMAIAQTDDKFTEWHFHDDANEGEGYLWKQLFFPKNVEYTYFMHDDIWKEGDEDDETAHHDLVDFSNALNSADVTSEAAKDLVAQYVDLDSILRLLALSHATGGFDMLISMKNRHPNAPADYYDNFKFSNMYMYRRDDEDGTYKYVFIGHDFGSVATGFYSMKTRKWYDDDFGDNREHICQNGEMIRPAGPAAGLYQMPAQCVPLFQILKIHFWQKYVEVFADVVEKYITEDSIEDAIYKSKRLIQSYVPKEPRKIPTLEDWHESVIDTENRFKVFRREEIEEMMQRGYVPPS